MGDLGLVKSARPVSRIFALSALKVCQVGVVGETAMLDDDVVEVKELESAAELGVLELGVVTLDAALDVLGAVELLLLQANRPNAADAANKLWVRFRFIRSSGQR